MSSAAEDRREEGVEFTHEDDLVTARDIGSSVASSGESKAGALALHEGGGEPIDYENAFLRETGIDPDEVDEDDSPPPWLV